MKKPQEQQPDPDNLPLSSLVAQRGIRTSEDLCDFFAGLMGDLVDGRIDAKTANAACSAGDKLLRVVELQLEHGDGKSGSLRFSSRALAAPPASKPIATIPSAAAARPASANRAEEPIPQSDGEDEAVAGEPAEPDIPAAAAGEPPSVTYDDPPSAGMACAPCKETGHFCQAKAWVNEDIPVCAACATGTNCETYQTLQRRKTAAIEA